MPKKNSLTEVPYRMERHCPNAPWEEVPHWEEWPVKKTMQAYPEREVFWEPNEPFEATLTLIHLERGRSAARFWWESTESTLYPMFGQSLVEMLGKLTLDRGTATGTWIAVKRGANYGIELY